VTNQPHQYDRPTDKFTQSELNDLIRELQLTKEKSALLGSRLREKNVLASGVKFSCYRNCDKNFENIMHRKINFYFARMFVIFCINWERKNMILAPGAFLSTLPKGLKAVLLHNSNVLASIPLVHSTKLFESYETLKLILQKIKYHEHEWPICGDLKVIGLLLGQQRGYTKFPCFLCAWDSRARDKYCVTVHWPEREQLQPGSKNVSNVFC
jgi:hypothetical protein